MLRQNLPEFCNHCNAENRRSPQNSQGLRGNNQKHLTSNPNSIWSISRSNQITPRQDFNAAAGVTWLASERIMINAFKPYCNQENQFSDLGNQTIQQSNVIAFVDDNNIISQYRIQHRKNNSQRYLRETSQLDNPFRGNWRHTQWNQNTHLLLEMENTKQ